MKKQVKTFNQFLNESRFHHSLPNNTRTGGARLRDEFRSLSQEDQDEISDLAAELEEAGLLNHFKRMLSKFNSIEELKSAMMNMSSQEEELDEPNWNIRNSMEDEESDETDGGYYYQ